MNKNIVHKNLGMAIALSVLMGYAGVAYAAASDYNSTEEYKNSTGLALIRADCAYALGATGKGVTLGITDDFVRLDHQEFVSKDGSGYIYGRPPADYDWLTQGHGTHVAGIMVAARDGVVMHGVAFDANILSDNFHGNLAEIYDMLNQRPDVKVINQSWAHPFYHDELVKAGEGDVDLGWLEPVNILKYSAKHDKLLVFSASNFGHTSSGIMSDLLARDHSINKNVMIVMASNPNTYNHDKPKYTIDSNGKVTEVSYDFIAIFSDLAKYSEESSITAPGFDILSAISENTNTYEYLDGTSMAAPHASGVAGLAQQVFPYMNAKQLGDVVLTGANKEFTLPKFTINVQKDMDRDSDDNSFKLTKVNLYYFGGAQSADDIIKDLKEYYKDNDWFIGGYYGLKTEEDFIKFVTGEGTLNNENNPQFKDGHMSIYYDVPREMVFGQGILDAYTAVRGPAQLNARRLSAADKDTLYTGDPQKAQALYKIDTQGYNSVWANDISEVQAGLLTADSSYTDLKAIYNYYMQGDKIYNFTEGQTYIDAYNKNAEDNGLIDLHVGLYKAGEGILALTGNNTYQGSTVAAGGTIQIDGKVATAYSLSGATIAGKGTIEGDLINQGTVQAGSYQIDNEIWLNPQKFVAGTLTVTGKLDSDNGAIAIASNDAVNVSKLEIAGAANINNAKIIGVQGSIYKPDTTYTAFLTAGSINGSFSQDNVFTGMLSAHVSTDTYSSNQADFTLSINNNMQLDNNGLQTFTAMQRMYDALTDSEREPLLKLLSMQTSQAQKATSELHTNNTTAMASALQSNTAMVRSINTRLSSVKNVNVSMPINGLNSNQMADVTIPLEFDSNNSWWFKLNKGWGSVNAMGDQAEISQNSFGAVIGRDIKVSDKWRIGGMFNYRNNTLSSADGSGNSYDYTLGMYAGYHYLAHELSTYLAAGIQNNTIKRNLTQLGMNTQGKYNSNTIQLGLRYTYDTGYGRDDKWKVKPYAAVDYTHYRQKGYSETGAGIFNQQVDSMNNNYLTGELGLELVRQAKNGQYYLRTGYKRVLSGANPDLTIAYAGNSGYKTRISSDRNSRNLLVMDLGANISMQNNWYVDMQLSGEFGSKSKQTGASVSLRRTW